MSESKIFIVARGPAGSGKSFTARKIMKELGGDVHNIFSTDNHFIPITRELRKAGEHVPPEDEAEEYKSNFKGWKLSVAHAENLDNFKKAIDAGVTPIMLDNTNVIAQHIQPYAQYAHAAGYRIEIVEPHSEWWQKHAPYLANKYRFADKIKDFASLLHKKNTHGVPHEAIERMLFQWEPNLQLKDILGGE